MELTQCNPVSLNGTTVLHKIEVLSINKVVTLINTYI